MRFADVILPIPLNGLFTYEIPPNLEEVENGMRVIVPFGHKKVYTAIVYRTHKREPQNYRAKPIFERLDLQPIISPTQFSLWEWISTYYCCGLGDVMNAALPSALKLSSQTKIHKIPSDNPISILTEKEQMVMNALENKSELTFHDVSKLLSKTSVFPVINALISKNIIGTFEEVTERYKSKRQRMVMLASPLVDNTDIIKKAPKQWQLLQQFIQLSNEKTSSEMSVQFLLRHSNSNHACLNALIKKGIFKTFEKEVSRLHEVVKHSPLPLTLSPQQVLAHAALKNSLATKNVVLFHGVTSSGKTEVLIQLIKEVIENHQQVLYLLPEIALTTQLIRRLRQHFGDSIAVYHSKFSNNERMEIWNEVKNTNRFSVVLGTRSALFLPFKQLGLIVIDEEHEITFKQHHSVPKYNARDTAIKYAQIHDAKVVLASATPSLESYYNAQSKKYGLVELNERYGGVKLPEIDIVDIKYWSHRKLMKGAFSPILLDHINEALEKKKQVILFQNRRGFAPLNMCGFCGFTTQCVSCDVSLTYHKNQDVLKCHYCGHTEPISKNCRSCGSNEMNVKGYGTEKIEEELQPFFPSSKISRLDLDTTKKKNAYDQIITDFENGTIDILIGTQMITKGLDFKNVSLVGIINADGVLNFPDFRSFERSFQLMSQVAGRAGRKGKQGKVIIQTYSADHDIIQAVQKNDFSAMYQTQMTERKAFNYPPFCKLISISVKHKNLELTNQAARDLAIHLRATFKEQVLGPEYPSVSRIKNRFIKKILLKIGPGVSLNKSKSYLMNVIQSLNQSKPYRAVRFEIDVDPI